MDSLLIGDEAGFALNGEVNSHNVREYAPKEHPPAFNFQRNNSRAKLTVLAGLCGNGLIVGPYIFEQNVNGHSYLAMLNKFVFPHLAVHFNNQYWEGLFRGLWWAQDGAPAHRLIQVRDRLNKVFGNNFIIGLGHNVEWPPISFGDISKTKSLPLHHTILMRYAKESSKSLMLYDNSLPSLAEPCLIIVKINNVLFDVRIFVAFKSISHMLNKTRNFSITSQA